MEKQYSAGVLSDRQIGEQHGCSHTQVGRMARKLGWTRDLSQRIKSKADTMVAKELTAAKSKATEKEIVAAGAEAMKQVKQRHRKDLVEAQSQVKTMLAELRNVSAYGDMLGPWALDLLTSDSISDTVAKKLLGSIERAIGLSDRAGVLKTLAEVLTKLVSSERESWGMNELAAQAPDPKPVPDMAKIDPAEAGMAYQEWANGTVGYGTKGG